MINSAFALHEEIIKKTLSFKLHQDLWSKYDLTTIDLDFDNWTTIKYLNEDCSQLNSAMNSIPNDKGGIYLFSIKCEVINKLTEYPVYIGRAQFTENQNLRKRCREYFTKYLRNDERPRITKMIKYWGAELYLSYFVVENSQNNDDNNNIIIDLEKKLINSLLLPFNTEIPDMEIRQAISAF